MTVSARETLHERRMAAIEFLFMNFRADENWTKDRLANAMITAFVAGCEWQATSDTVIAETLAEMLGGDADAYRLASHLPKPN